MSLFRSDKHCLNGDAKQRISLTAMKRTEEQRLEHIIRRMQTDTAIDAPAAAMAYAKNLYRTRAAEPKASVVSRILAVMTADLAPGRPVMGERSAFGGQARQMLFECGDNAIDLRISPADGKFELRGQVLGEGFENGEIELTGTTSNVKAKINESSEFSIAGLKAGDHSVTIRKEAKEIFIEKISF